MYFLRRTLFCCLIIGALSFDPDVRCDQNNVKGYLTDCALTFQRAASGDSASDEKNFCDAIYNLTQCSYAAVKQHCDSDFVPVYMRSLFKPVVQPYLCPHCQKAIEFMEELGGHLYHLDEENNVLKSFCSLDPFVNESCLSSIRRLEWELNNCEAFNTNETSYEERCNSLYRHHKCIFTEVRKRCGFASAKQFMAEDHLYLDYFFVTNSSFCLHCTEDIKFLDRFGRRIRYGDFVFLNNSRDCSPDDIVEPVCVESNETVLQTRICETLLLIDAPYEEYCDSLNDTIQCVFDSVTENCGSGTAKYYLKHLSHSVPNFSYCPNCSETVSYLESIGTHLYDLSKENGTCPDPQANTTTATPTTTTITTTTSRTTTTTEDATVACLRRAKDSLYICPQKRHQVSCGDVDQYIRCTFRVVSNICGNATAGQYMITDFKATISSEMCPFCDDVIVKMEDQFRSHLYITGNEAKYCRRECTYEKLKDEVNECKDGSGCSFKLEKAKCVFDKVRNRCGEAQAKDYMIRLKLKVQPELCSQCYEVIDYLESFGGHLYHEDPNGNLLYTYCTKFDCEQSTLGDQVYEACNGTGVREVDWFEYSEKLCKNTLKYAQCANRTLHKQCGGDKAKYYMQQLYRPKFYTCSKCRELVKYMDQFGGKVEQVDRHGNTLSGITCPLVENMECVTKNALPLMRRCEKLVHDLWAPHYCSELDHSMSCIYNEIDAVCGEKVAKEHMKKNATPTAMASQCPYCRRVAKYMEKHGGHLYYADEEHRLQHVYCSAEIIDHYWKNVNGVSGTFISDHVFYSALIFFSFCFMF